ncbi:MAG: hypothetical protein JNL45_04950 [Hyphomicrobium sp.]|nr:hypothetical protein [Hyphomicrobium sp.]
MKCLTTKKELLYTHTGLRTARVSLLLLLLATLSVVNEIALAHGIHADQLRTIKHRGL